MSTVVLTLVVVGGSIAAATKLALNGERKPATEAPHPHRGWATMLRARSARNRSVQVVGLATGDVVSAKPGLLLRVRSAAALTALTAMIGAGVALLILAGAAFVADALQSAVK